MSLKITKNKINFLLLTKINNLPPKSGCYLFKNCYNNIIYIGKAKNLFSRIKSYFYLTNHNPKTNNLIQEICDLEYIITHNELEAFILEANLIKKHIPKYNFKLLDDKNYAYIEITNEKHPRLKISYYKKVPTKTKVFGPYPYNNSMKETVRLLHKIYPLRRCQPIPQKPCHYYQINECLGPCCPTNKSIDYSINIRGINDFLQGKNKNIFNKIKNEIKMAIKTLNFEKAQEYQKILEHLKNITIKQFIELKPNLSCDIIGFCFNKNEISLYIFKMYQGKIQEHYQVVSEYIDDPIDNMITYLHLYYQNHLLPKKILLNPSLIKQKPEIKKIINTKFSVKFNNEEKQIQELAQKNAEENLNKYNLLYSAKLEATTIALSELSKLYQNNINHIEVFDISHSFGKYFVSGIIVFKNYQLQKKSYCAFRIKQTYPNEYNSLAEAIERRYQKLINLNLPFPDLILVDGGIGQFNISQKILKNLIKEFNLGALKKNNKHQLESLILPNQEILLNQKSFLFRFLFFLSEEVHNFTINFHRKINNQENISNLI
ncbi:excinuclease ABC subunit UvrC [Candidatus Phytoplasma gossypii]|uniref:Excinuclease ABC subunit UvrC n=1 Tax=Candidatus Phytoplasma gossypii TaxID=2982629 RepID=A0ABT9D2A6_9MOLU|nr:excinuclease ABC subunit UvrC ['Gossypium sp.' phytoplasma]MDO8057425.1 excinuclease ABC subunit UvrC ['Gossypium sp.' phytoplasma]